MNENELRRALTGHASGIRPNGDPERLVAGMARTDRLRTTRMMGAGCLAAVIVTFGVLDLSGGGGPSPVDIVDRPTLTTPTDPEIGLPILDDSATETSTTVSDGASNPTTSLAPASPATTPAHLADDTPSTTSISIAVVATTLPSATAPPITSAAPATSTPTTTAAPAPTVVPTGFTASARYGSCAEDPPYDEYSGTAAPGTTITVSSPYSARSSVTADLNGDWWIRVEFPASPFEAHFDVSVSDGTSSRVFDFVRTS